jgi:L-threonylcarbamoyladenylate synthase
LNPSTDNKPGTALANQLSGFAAIKQGAALLAQGELVVMPTETVYGLAADAGQQSAVSKIYALKGRPADHPLIVHGVDVHQMQAWAWLEDAALARRFDKLAQAFWPGPLTMVMPLHPDKPRFASAGQASVGLRVPSHPVAQALLREAQTLGVHGVAAPSANRFGKISPTKAQHVQADLGNNTPFLLEGGASHIGLESTIIDLTRGAPIVLRPGHITASELQQVLGEAVMLSANVADPASADVLAPKASGTLAAHYAPITPVRLLESAQYLAALDAPRVVGLALGTDPAQYAAQLYDQLRSLDAMGANQIVIEQPPATEAWLAALDRVRRAAAAF